jgi:hypothetical protein
MQVYKGGGEYGWRRESSGRCQPNYSLTDQQPAVISSPTPATSKGRQLPSSGSVATYIFSIYKEFVENGDWARKMLEVQGGREHVVYFSCRPTAVTVAESAATQCKSRVKSTLLMIMH